MAPLRRYERGSLICCASCARPSVGAVYLCIKGSRAHEAPPFVAESAKRILSWRDGPPEACRAQHAQRKLEGRSRYLLEQALLLLFRWSTPPLHTTKHYDLQQPACFGVPLEYIFCIVNGCGDYCDRRPVKEPLAFKPESQITSNTWPDQQSRPPCI